MDNTEKDGWYTGTCSKNCAHACAFISLFKHINTWNIHFLECNGLLIYSTHSCSFRIGFRLSQIKLSVTKMYFSGKKYCYGSSEGEYCHCDYCKVHDILMGLSNEIMTVQTLDPICKEAGGKLRWSNVQYLIKCSIFKLFYFVFNSAKYMQLITMIATHVPVPLILKCPTLQLDAKHTNAQCMYAFTMLLT